MVWPVGRRPSPDDDDDGNDYDDDDNDNDDGQLAEDLPLSSQIQSPPVKAKSS